MGRLGKRDRWSDEEDEVDGLDVGASQGRQNRFRFRGLHERVKAVQIDAFRSVRGSHEEESGAPLTVSYFHSALSRTHADSQLEPVASLHWAVSRHCLSLPLLLHSHRRVVDALLESLRQADRFSRILILRLVPELARDLQHLFLPYFERILAVMVLILDPTDVELMEEILNALAFVLKILRRSLVKDLDSLFVTSRSLLFHRKSYVRDLAAQSFAFLLRSVEATELEAFVDSLWSCLEPDGLVSSLPDPDLHYKRDAAVDGIGLLLYQSVRGFVGRMYSKSPAMFVSILNSALKVTDRCEEDVAKVLVTVVEHSVAFCRKHLSDMQFLWEEILERRLAASTTASSARVLMHVLSSLYPAIARTPFGSAQFISKTLPSLVDVANRFTIADSLKDVLLFAFGDTHARWSIKDTTSLVAALHLMPQRQSLIEALPLPDYLSTTVVSSLASAMIEALDGGAPENHWCPLPTILRFFRAVPRDNSFWEDSSRISRVIFDTASRGLALAESVEDAFSVCVMAIQRYPELVPGVVALATRLEQQTVGNEMLQSRIRMLLHSAGCSRLDECLAAVSSSLPASPAKPYLVEALAHCLSITSESSLSSTVITEALWNQVKSACELSLMAADARERMAALKAFGVFSALMPACQFFADLYAIQVKASVFSLEAQSSMAHEMDVLKTKCSRVNLGKDVQKLVWEALLGCFFVRLRLVTIGAIGILKPSLSDSAVWAVIGKFTKAIHAECIADTVKNQASSFGEEELEGAEANADADADVDVDVDDDNIDDNREVSLKHAKDRLLQTGGKRNKSRKSVMVAQEKGNLDDMSSPLSPAVVLKSLHKFFSAHLAESERFARWLVPCLFDAVETLPHTVSLVRMWMELFCCFKNLPGLARFDDIVDLAERFIDNRDPSLRVSSLIFISNKDKDLAPFLDSLKVIANPSAHNGGSFALDTHLRGLHMEDIDDDNVRSKLRQIIARLFLPKFMLLCKKRVPRLAAARELDVIMSFFASLKTAELDEIAEDVFQGAIEPGSHIFTFDDDNDFGQDVSGGGIEVTLVNAPPPAIQVLSLLNRCIVSVGSWKLRAVPYFPICVRIAAWGLIQDDQQLVERAVQLLQLILTTCRGTSVFVDMSPLLAPLVEASRVPLARMVDLAKGATSSEWEGSFWLDFVRAASESHLLDDFFRLSGVVSCLIEGLSRCVSTPGEARLHSVSMRTLKNLCPYPAASEENDFDIDNDAGEGEIEDGSHVGENGTDSGFVDVSQAEAQLKRFQESLVPMAGPLLDYLADSLAGERIEFIFSSERQRIRNHLFLLRRLTPYLGKSHGVKLMQVILPTVIASVSTLYKDADAMDFNQVRREKEFCGGVDMIQSLLPTFQPKEFLPHVQTLLKLVPLIGWQRAMTIRLCSLLEAFVRIPDATCSSLQLHVAALGNMLSFSQVSIGEPDVNRRLLGLETALRLHNELSDASVRNEDVAFLLVLHPILFCTASPDLSIREQALAGFATLLSRAHRVHSPAQPGCVEEHVLPWIRRILSSSLDRAVLQGAMKLLRDCVVEAPVQYPDLAALLDASGQRAEEAGGGGGGQVVADFFLAAFHPRYSVREVASRKLRKMLKRYAKSLAADSSKQRDDSVVVFRMSTLTNLFLPMYMHCLLRLDGAGKVEAREYRVELIHVVQAIASLLPYDEWCTLAQELAGGWDRAIETHRSESLFMHAFCSVVDSFHFEEGNYGPEAIQAICLERLMKNVQQASSDPAAHKKQKGSLKKKVAGKGLRINVRVVVTAIKLLQNLSPDMRQSFLLPLLQSVCNSLAEHDESIRDATRKTLAQVAATLGPSYFAAIVNGMRATLKRGYEIQVMYYSLHYVFSAMSESLANAPGCIDSLAGPLSALLLEDILGLTASKKEVAKLQATYKECRDIKSFHTFELLASAVTFPDASWSLTAFQDMMQPVVDMLQFSKSKRDLKRLRQVLDRVLTGLSRNTTAAPEILLSYAYSLASENMPAEQSSRRIFGAAGVLGPASSAKSAAAGTGFSASASNIHAAAIKPLEELRRTTLLTLREDTERSKFLIEKSKRDELTSLLESEDNFAVNRVLLAEFGLKILLAQLRSMPANADAQKTGASLDRFVQVCSQALLQENDGVVCLALECLRELLRWSSAVPSLPSLIGRLADQSLVVLERTNVTQPLGRACFLFVTAVSKRQDAVHWKMSEAHAAFLLQLVKQELDAQGDFSSCFTLLTSMVSRKVMSADLYDIMDSLRSFAVTHETSSIRQSCASILVKFLVVYPMTDAKRNRFINKILQDLSYDEPVGREAVLELLNVVFLKFPCQLLSELAELIFVPLVARLASEPDRRVRSVCGAALVVFLQKIDDASLDTVFSICINWYTAGSGHVAGGEASDRPSEEPLKLTHVASAQTLGLFVEAGRVSKERRRRASQILEARILQALGGTSPSVQSSEWLLTEAERIQQHALQDAFLYQSLHSLERCLVKEKGHGSLLKAVPLMLRSSSLICRVLRYPHMWVRASGARIWSVLGPAVYDTWDNLRVPLIAMFRVLEDLDSSIVGTEAAPMLDILLQDMLQLLLHLVKQPPPDGTSDAGAIDAMSPSPATRRKRALVVADADDESDSSDGSEAESGGALEARDGSGVDAMDDQAALLDELDETRVDHAALLRENPLEWIILKLGKLATAPHAPAILQLGVFKLFAGLVFKLEPERSVPLLESMLRPLFQLCPWDASSELALSKREGNQEMYVLSQQVLATFKDRVGVQAFVRATNSIRAEFHGDARVQRETDAVRFLVEPARANAEKLHKMKEKTKAANKNFRERGAHAAGKKQTKRIKK